MVLFYGFAVFVYVKYERFEGDSKVFMFFILHGKPRRASKVGVAFPACGGGFEPIITVLDAAKLGRQLVTITRFQRHVYCSRRGVNTNPWLSLACGTPLPAPCLGEIQQFPTLLSL